MSEEETLNVVNFKQFQSDIGLKDIIEKDPSLAMDGDGSVASFEDVESSGDEYTCKISSNNGLLVIERPEEAAREANERYQFGKNVDLATDEEAMEML